MWKAEMRLQRRRRRSNGVVLSKAQVEVLCTCRQGTADLARCSIRQMLHARSLYRERPHVCGVAAEPMTWLQT